MNQTQAKTMLPILKAFAAGKTIQYLSASGLWIDADVFYTDGVWRIKPEQE